MLAQKGWVVSDAVIFERPAICEKTDSAEFIRLESFPKGLNDWVTPRSHWMPVPRFRV